MGATTGITTVTGIPASQHVSHQLFRPKKTSIALRTELASVVSHGLSVVAGRGGDDSLPLLRLVEHEQRVPGPPLLETPGVLHVLLLQEDVHLGLFAHVRGLRKFSAVCKWR